MCLSVLLFVQSQKFLALPSPTSLTYPTGFHVILLTFPPLILMHKISCRNCHPLELFLNPLRFCFPVIVISLVQVNS